jgi:adenylosuccinate lyase
VSDVKVYDNPLVSRYASSEMSYIWSPEHKFRLWRRFWLALAEAERDLGLPITAKQLAEMREHLADINYATARRYERQLRHDVMAHVRAFADQCPAARAIIHLGATSSDVTDNAELIQLRDSLELVVAGLVNVIAPLARFARRHRALATLGYTHFQPAQPTTVGKRACLWLQDLLLDLTTVERALGDLRFHGVKGATGTQASFLELFQGDARKVRRLEQAVARKMGFEQVFPVTGQTYPRKVDSGILSALAGVGQSAQKFATDLRLLAHLREVEEPFEADQVGSSAMPHKRNPMRAERITALARFLIILSESAAFTAAEQWLERTLDDSANRRLTLPQAFLAADGILRLWQNVAAGLVVNREVIREHLRRELPFLACERVLMEAVRGGGDRQQLHERLRQHAQSALAEVKAGRANDLFSRLGADHAFAPYVSERLLDPQLHVGLARQQTEEFLAEAVTPVLRRHRRRLGRPVELQA